MRPRIHSRSCKNFLEIDTFDKNGVISGWKVQLEYHRPKISSSF